MNVFYAFLLFSYYSNIVIISSVYLFYIELVFLPYFFLFFPFFRLLLSLACH